ncbi:MAG: hypothetical protein A3E87_04235 [Gammaproteobacteria bacterium RIFCSPHIGHO2_12_FULL_35_23]|nr:MAG: hypothetical protein A3E87_04235 [Gammaproteobacteria bacterium RIFCSPHIGHO2_12_FULL_35_23]
MNKKLLVVLIAICSLSGSYALSCDSKVPSDLLPQFANQSVITNSGWVYVAALPNTTAATDSSPTPAAANVTNSENSVPNSVANNSNAATLTSVNETDSDANPVTSSAEATNGIVTPDDNSEAVSSDQTKQAESSTNNTITSSTSQSSPGVNSTTNNTGPTLPPPVVIPSGASFQLQSVEMGEIPQPDGSTIAGILCTYQDQSSGITVTAFKKGYYYIVRNNDTKWQQTPGSNGMICTSANAYINPKDCLFDQIVNWP